MNQIELNKIAMNYIEAQSLDISSKIEVILAEDLMKRKDEIPGPAIHHIHNLAIYKCLVRLNGLFGVSDNSKNALMEYCTFASSLEPKFLEIVEALKDFMPSGKDSNHNDNLA